MNLSDTLINALKRELRSRGITYRALAVRIGLSEASVKRMFSQKSIDLRRLDAILDAIGAEPHTLIGAIGEPEHLLEQMNWTQEAEIVNDARLFTVAVCALSLLTFEQIISVYRLSPAECIQHLLRLEKLGFLEMHPNNRYRLRVSRTFRWLPDGPIVRYFRSQAVDFLSHGFDGPGEAVGVLNVRISNEARLALKARLLSVIAEFSEQHVSDTRLPLSKRYPMSVLFGVRSWEPANMRAQRRLDDAALARWLRQQR
jgi:transcriptional regulator with XRE-family HTH domain